MKSNMFIIKLMSIFVGIIIYFSFPNVAFGTSYYIDFVNGSDNNAGTGTTSAAAWASLDKFTDNARSAGDIAFVRRGMATTSNITDLTFTSDGTLNNPITLTADYDNLWSDFATSTDTYTLTFGSKFIASSASSTDVSVGEWVYVAGDCGETYNATTLNTCEFAYEIASSSAAGFDFYLPYKGNQSGAGLYLRIMPSAPQWNTVTGDFQLAMSSDNSWYFKGLDIRGTDAGCNFQTVGNIGTKLFDMILQGNGITDCGMGSLGLGITIYKSRFFGHVQAFTSPGSIGKDSLDSLLFDCNSVASSGLTNAASAGIYRLSNSEIKNCTNITVGSAGGFHELYFRNIKSHDTFSGISGSGYIRHYFEDKFSVPALNAQRSDQIANNSATTTISTSTVIRIGGGATSQMIMPPTGTANTGISTKFFPFSFIRLFEYPIYGLASTQYTYSMYFYSTSTTAWNKHPTASEWWIECEAYGDNIDADRKLVKSTNTFNASSTAWQAFSVSCTPTQSGIVYLRGWYGHPNDGRSNWLFMDVAPVISSP